MLAANWVLQVRVLNCDGSFGDMTTIEERLNSLEQEVAELKALLDLAKPVKKDWESTVGAFQDDPLFVEAMKLGRKYRESQRLPDDAGGA